MKKILAVVLALVFVLSLAACGEKDKNDSGKASSSKKYATLQAYIDDPVNMQGFDKMKEDSADVMDIDVVVEGSTLVYDYRFKAVMDAAELPDVKTTLDQKLDDSSASFVQMAQSIQRMIEETIDIKVRYRNGDGEVITEKSFHP